MTRPEETDSQIRSAALAYLASPWHVLAFAPAMERTFRADTLAGRLRRYRSFGLVGILIYMAYTGVDWFALHDIFPSIWPWRLLGMPLITGSVIALSFWRRFQPWCDLGMVGATTLGTLALVVFFSLSLTPASNHYYGGVLLCGVYLMFVLRTGFVPTAWGCGFILAGFTLALEGLQGVDPPTRLVIAAVTASTLLLGLAGLYQLERDERRSYALALLRRMDGAALAQANARLAQLSAVDGLTGLLNRRAFETRLHEVWEAAATTGGEVGRLFIDVDEFKAFNDFYGHQAGDEVLRQVARLLDAHTRATADIAARYGGEEFLVLMPGCSRHAALERAERLRAGIEAACMEHAASPVQGCVTVSIGLATQHPASGVDPAALVRAADEALYAAKAAGRNRVMMPSA